MKKIKNNNAALLFILVNLIMTFNAAVAQVPDPNQGLRADWMRGSLGFLWLPENNYNGNIEGVSIDDFITQIKNLKTVDFIQVGLASPYIYSPVHTAPHPILESLWQGDTDSSGKPINLVVPRASKSDPFLSWLKAIRAAGLKTEVYVNSCNLLQWTGQSTPSAFPDFTNRWKAYCDTNATVQAFINSKSYHKDGLNDDRRPYMFCYAEFILKEYAVRYGDLIDAWCFDAAHVNIKGAGDDNTGTLDKQRIYQAFADAVHAGNPNAAVTFNNGIGDRNSVPFNPYVTPSLFEDYKFGHPFGGAGNMVEPRDPLYAANFGICEFMRDKNGLPYKNDAISWNDNVVAHFFPKQSTSSWNDGGIPCLTNAEFVEWNNVGLINGGSITWGTPLVRTNLLNSPVLTLQPYALTQLELVDANLSQYQYPGAPNWARAYTILPDATIGIPYSHTLTEGVDFWDPEGDAITALLAQGSFPSWLIITKTGTGVWKLSGTPTETVAKTYKFSLQASDASGSRNRTVNLNVLTNSNPVSVDVQIKATASTNYGKNTIAKMYSEVKTAPDGLATYKLKIEVTPPTGKTVISGLSGGLSTENSWGLGDGSNENSDDIFNGNENEWVQSIKNIQIIDFNANGGNSTINDFSASFKSITIENAQSSNDNVSLSSGTATANPGKLGNQTQVLNLESLLGIQNITDFAIGVGNASETNKWSVEGITVTVDFKSVLSVLNPEKDNLQTIILYPNPADDFITLNIPIHSAKIIDMTGKVVKTFATETNSFDVSNLKTGTYLLKGVSQEGKIVVKTFIKK